MKHCIVAFALIAGAFARGNSGAAQAPVMDDGRLTFETASVRANRSGGGPNAGDVIWDLGFGIWDSQGFVRSAGVDEAVTA